MVSSSPSADLFDPIRKKWVKSTPEERIRQQLIYQMVNQLGYASHLMAIEKELAQLPHLTAQEKAQIVKRRIDILIYAPHTLEPLFMIECKAIPLSTQGIQQVIGYNSFVRAPFIGLANHQKVITGFFDPAVQKYRFEKGLPHFDQLLAVLK